VRPSRGGRKFYAVRSAHRQIAGKRHCRTFYLHVEIHKRTGVPPPSAAHIIVDHRDGDSFNCRRSNLRWATYSMNSMNTFGRIPHDLIEG
jgi:hypothetical protein